MKKNVSLLFVLLFFVVTTYSQVNLSNNLLASFPFSGNAADASGNGNTTIVHGATLTTDRFNNIDKAYLFDGTDDFIEINYQYGNRSENQYSVAMWVLADPVQVDYAKLLSVPYNLTGWNDPFHYLSLQFYNNDNFAIWYSYSYGTFVGPLTSQTWHFLAMTYNGSEFKLYVDGEIENSTPTALAQMFFPADNKISIGSRSVIPAHNGEYFHGKIDDIRLYNRTLNSAEIQTLYYLNQNSPSVPLSLWSVAGAFLLIAIFLLFKKSSFLYFIKK